MLRVYKLKSLRDAINAQAPSVATIKRECGEEFTHSLLMSWLVHLNELLQLNKPMSEAQIQLCATTILTEFKHLKMSDLTLLFYRVITGQLGEFYESLSIAKLLNFFRQYEKERTELITEEAQRQHHEFRYQEGKNESKKEVFIRQTKKFYR